MPEKLSTQFVSHKFLVPHAIGRVQRRERGLGGAKAIILVAQFLGQQAQSWIASRT